jgi:cellobiose-specific phosphotransferase system component IIB
METSEIIRKIQNALEKCSLESGIDKRDVRVKIVVDKGFIANSVKCSLLNKTDFVYDIEMRNLLGLNPIESTLVSNFLSKTLKNMADQDGIPVENINARIYTKSDDYYPSVYLYNLGKAIRPITVEELTNAD